MNSETRQLLAQIRACTLCEKHLPLGPRPVVQFHPKARILLVGQAPGRKVHASGKPFDDASGDRLRNWLGITADTFYNAKQLAIVPMGFCYPGTGKSGDLPPRPECAPAWRHKLLPHLEHQKLTLAIGRYAHDWHFSGPKMTVTERVQRWREYWPEIVPLPHPSPRNNLWLRRNPWFETELIPQLKQRVQQLIN
ncbi:Uracil-DNA glycosylase [Pseudidiomarina planktonica]|uniref:Uracil-DNA glycosylase n=1 Tax=Pseudidiomarina planktonica TaxID=1323738 RepID=A0A1Y6G2S3_9GAMM|nr:uracil-DNA glycosylase family protein [Pseudidiomarina planktonica]RUO64035.1 uracil-DNA glycosylase [Pseudidiomarina planktonica]SMQ79866.1 Uracil-DNA glycosylase [Pseudidiomarina planktonica]